MADYLYRGTSLSDANREEFAYGRIDGFTADIYRGKIAEEGLNKTVTKGTPLDELPWWTPEPGDQPYMAQEQGVTGGLSNIIGTGIDFAHGGVPIVLYLNERALNGTGQRVRYQYDFFDSVPGTLAWVYGSNIKGEIHDMDAGLVGLVSQGEDGPVVWAWGQDEIQQWSYQYESEHEVVVLDSSIDISDAVEAVAIILEGRNTPAQALGTFDGFHAGFGSDAVDVSRWSTEQQLEVLHKEVRREAATNLDNLLTINLTTNVVEKVSTIPKQGFDYAYSESWGFLDYEDLDPALLGHR